MRQARLAVGLEHDRSRRPNRPNRVSCPPGPTGPGATDLVFNASGTASLTPTTLGNMGPYSVSGECIESGGGTRTVVLEQGPGATVDGFAIEDTAARAISVLSNPAHSTQETEAYHLFLDPSSGSPVETTITLSAIGVTTNTCHVSVVAIPTS